MPRRIPLAAAPQGLRDRLVVGGPARVGHVRRQNTVIEHQASPADAAHTPVRIDARARKRKHVASHARRFLASHRTNNTVRTTSNQAHRGMGRECSPGLADTSARSPRLCCDSGNCELPARGVELGETAATAAERKVVEECGVTIKVTRLAGIFTDPGRHGLPATGEARQQFPVCSHALPVDGQPHPDHDETCEAAWIAPP